ncbi:hypothetical protein JXA80_04825 [bacterium]|nr:hypothetical protein [candidate division CSSED10-310 bacterium]
MMNTPESTHLPLADRLLTIDRRFIYLFVMLAAVIPFMFKVELDVEVTPEVMSVYSFIDKLKPGTPILLAADYDPQTQAENGPQAEALLRHMFKNNLRVIIMTLSQDGAAMAEMLSTSISAEYNKIRGEDYVYLGYKPYFGIIILSIGQNFRISYPADFYDTPLDEIPMMKNIHNYSDLACVIQIGGGNVTHAWLTNAHERYKVPLAIAVTAVSGPQYYATLQSGQIFGLIGGLKGAAEYETLLRDEYRRLGIIARAIQGMNVQNFVHILIILLTLVGNAAFFVKKRQGGR